jgi:hypothetical protein
VTVAANTCLVEDNSTIWVYGVINTGPVSNRSSANVHLRDAADFVRGGVRVAKQVSGNSFDLYEGNGTTPVVPNGLWAHGGIIARAQLTAVKPPPILYADGDGGPVTNGLMNNAAGGWGEEGRLSRIAVAKVAAAHTGYDVAFRDPNGQLSLIEALDWWAKGKPISDQSRTDAIQAMVNSPLWPVPGCDPKRVDCGYGASSIMDYKWELWPAYKAFAYSLMRSELTPEQRQTFINNALDDKPWMTGGQGYTTMNRVIPPFKPQHGKISFVDESNPGGAAADVTGVATRFVTDGYAPGDYIYLGAFQYPEPYAICRVLSETSLTLCRTVEGTDNRGAPLVDYRVSPAWVEGTHVGWAGFGYNTHYNSLCGADLVNGPFSCPDHFAIEAGEFDAWNNHTIGRVVRYMQVGLALSEDPRGALLAGSAAQIWYHLIRPHTVNFGGPIASSTGYALGRMWAQFLEAAGSAMFSLVGSPDLGDDHLWKSAVNQNLAILRTSATGPQYHSVFQMAGEGAFEIYDGGSWTPSFVTMLFKPVLLESQWAASAFRTWPGFSSEIFEGHKGQYLPLNYLGDRPDITPLPAPTSQIMTTLGAPCTYKIGKFCFDEPRIALGSRSGYTRNDVSIWFNASSGSNRDHANREVGPWLDIDLYDGSLYGPDHFSGVQVCGVDNPSVSCIIGQGTIAVVGADSNVQRTYPNVTPMRALREYGADSLAALTVDMTATFIRGVTGAYRTIAHVKGSDAGLGWILDRFDATLPSADAARVYHHYKMGTVSFDGADTVSNTTGHARLLSRFLTGTASTASGDPGAGTYPGGNGVSFRIVATSAPATSHVLLTVHRPTLDKSETLPPITASISGPHRVVAIAAANPVVFLSAPGGTTKLTSAAATTSVGPARLVVDGLAAGTYKVQSNGVDVLGCTRIAVRARKHVLECRGVPSGAITVLADGGDGGMREGGGPPVSTGAAPRVENTRGTRVLQ